MKKILLSAAALITAAFTFTGCYDAIFQNIRKEVPLKEANVAGFINKIARFTDPEDHRDYLFTQNGNIYYKKVANSEDEKDAEGKTLHDYGAWNIVNSESFTPVQYDYYSSTFSGTHFYSVASDQNYIYALGFEPTQDDTEGVNVPSVIKLYCTDKISSIKNWTEIKTVNNYINGYTDSADPSKNISGYIPSLYNDKWKYTEYFLKNISICLFCTDDLDAANREAYIRIGGGSGKTTNESSSSANYWDGTANSTYKIFKLNGKSTSDTLTDKTDSNSVSYKSNFDDGTSTVTANSVSAVKFNGKTYFFDHLASGKYTNGGVDQCMYYGKGSLVYYSTDGTFDENKKIIGGSSYSIISMAITKDSIITGTQGGGAFRVLLSSDGKGTPVSSGTFETNADSIMTPPYIIRMLFCETPLKAEKEATIYSSMDFIYTASSAGTSYKNRGLWSYYPERNDGTEYRHWNRE